MYCYNCGKEIPENSQYCTYCNARVGASSGDTSSLPVCKITFGQAIRNFFAQYATFSGRATRSEYWYVVLFNVLINLAISIVFGLISTDIASIVSSIYSLAILIPGLALVWRRLHDIGKSGGWYFMLLIPLVGWIILLVFLCTDSGPDNRFGSRKV